jgi:hypothetical protein
MRRRTVMMAAISLRFVIPTSGKYLVFIPSSSGLVVRRLDILVLLGGTPQSEIDRKTSTRTEIQVLRIMTPPPTTLILLFFHPVFKPFE